MAEVPALLGSAHGPELTPGDAMGTGMYTTGLPVELMMLRHIAGPGPKPAALVMVAGFAVWIGAYICSVDPPVCEHTPITTSTLPRPGVDWPRPPSWTTSVTPCLAISAS